MKTRPCVVFIPAPWQPLVFTDLWLFVIIEKRTSVVNRLNFCPAIVAVWLVLCGPIYGIDCGQQLERGSWCVRLQSKQNVVSCWNDTGWRWVVRNVFSPVNATLKANTFSCEGDHVIEFLPMCSWSVSCEKWIFFVFNARFDAKMPRKRCLFFVDVQGAMASSDEPSDPPAGEYFELEADKLNQHECMAPMVALITHMHQNGIGEDVSRVCGWRFEALYIFLSVRLLIVRKLTLLQSWEHILFSFCCWTTGHLIEIVHFHALVCLKPWYSSFVSEADPLLRPNLTRAEFSVLVKYVQRCISV